MLNKLTNRILLSYAVPLTFLVGLGILVYATALYTFRLERRIERTDTLLEMVDQVTYELSKIARTARGQLVFPGDRSYRDAYEASKVAYQTSAEMLANQEPTFEAGADIETLLAEGNTLIQTADQVFQFLSGGDIPQATRTLDNLEMGGIDATRDAIHETIGEIKQGDRNLLKRLQTILLLLVAVGTAVAILATLLVGLRIGLPIRKQLPVVVDAAQRISQGDLTREIAPTDQTDEIGQLLQAFRTMTENLNSLVTQVQKSGIQIATSTTQIAAAGKQLEATVTEQVASTNEVRATAREIATTSEDLTKTMEVVADLAQTTAQSASDSQSQLMQMQTAMQELGRATKSISSRLGVMNEKANNINSVVTTITKVADQTNLLSLNAAIEAEKAGEYGAGFAVVAREIRRLADQTAVATLDIEQMVKEMQAAVSAGVMEMDKFNKEVSGYVAEVGTISEQMSQVIAQVQSLTPRFDAVTQKMDIQSQGAEQISTAIAQLSEASQQTMESLQDTNSALEQLDDAAQGLQQEVFRFKVRG